MDDARSDGRLLYELALSSEGRYTIRKTENGLVRQESHTKHGLVWMKLLELPLVELKGRLTPHVEFLKRNDTQEELKDGTNCSIEVYGFEGQVPRLCDPYALISGKMKDEVDLVAANVEDKLRRHQEGCHCKFRNRISMKEMEMGT